jgi:hypothetical protein
MAEPSRFTAFRVPFDPNQASLIGLFTAIWSQIDSQIELCVAKLLDVPLSGAAILMEAMTTGPRVNLFGRLARERIADEAIKKVAKKFCADMSALIDKRNHIMHGMWGFHVDQQKKTTIPAASYSKYRGSPILITDMPKIIADVARQTHAIAAVYRHLYKLEEPPAEGEQPAMFFGDGPPPEWL